MAEMMSPLASEVVVAAVQSSVTSPVAFHLATSVVDVDHRARNVEERDHFRTILRHDQRMDLARGLVHEAALLGDPVVLEIAPLAADYIAHDDHRMAMCFSLAALGGVAIRINDPQCVSKTFPDYFAAFAKLAA